MIYHLTILSFSLHTRLYTSCSGGVSYYYYNNNIFARIKLFQELSDGQTASVVAVGPLAFYHYVVPLYVLFQDQLPVTAAAAVREILYKTWKIRNDAINGRINPSTTRGYDSAKHVHVRLITIYSRDSGSLSILRSIDKIRSITQSVICTVAGAFNIFWRCLALLQFVL